MVITLQFVCVMDNWFCTTTLFNHVTLVLRISGSRDAACWSTRVRISRRNTIVVSPSMNRAQLHREQYCTGILATCFFGFWGQCGQRFVSIVFFLDLLHKITNKFFPFDDETALSIGSGRTGDQGRGHEVSGRGSNAASGSSGPSVF